MLYANLYSLCICCCHYASAFSFIMSENSPNSIIVILLGVYFMMQVLVLPSLHTPRLLLWCLFFYCEHVSSSWRSSSLAWTVEWGPLVPGYWVAMALRKEYLKNPKVVFLWLKSWPLHMESHSTLLARFRKLSQSVQVKRTKQKMSGEWRDAGAQMAWLR